jgi:hypothetical protein
LQKPAYHLKKLYVPLGNGGKMALVRNGFVEVAGIVFIPSILLVAAPAMRIRSVEVARVFKLN